MEKMVSLSLISSSRCNMKCSFCYLHKNKSFYEYDKYLRAMWRNGDYIENVKKTIDKLGINPNDITNVTFWGGETTIDLDDIIPALPKMFEYFPKIKRLWFSTNWHTSVDKIVEFYKAWGQAAPDNQYISMQASIDGPPGPCCEQGHPGDWDIYIKNYKRLAELWPEAQKEVPKLRSLKLTTNSTIGKELYYDIFSDKQKTYNYLKFMLDKEKEIREIVTAGGVLGFKINLPGIALPIEGGADEGFKYFNSVMNITNVINKYFSDNQWLMNSIPIRNREAPYTDLLMRDYACGSLLSSFNILPDGTITECHSSFADVLDPYYQELKDSDDHSAVLAARLNRKIAFNPIKMTDEEIARMKEIIMNGYRNSIATITALKMGMLQEMALSGQVDNKLINNPILQLKTVRVNSMNNTCSRENLIQTHNPYLSSPDQFRRLYNGLAEYILNHPEKQQKMREGYWNAGK